MFPRLLPPSDTSPLDMTIQERLTAFLMELAHITEKYGCMMYVLSAKDTPPSVVAMEAKLDCDPEEAYAELVEWYMDWIAPGFKEKLQKIMDDRATF